MKPALLSTPLPVLLMLAHGVLGALEETVAQEASRNDLTTTGTVEESREATPEGLILFDDFEYVVDRNEAGASAIFVHEGGWAGAKTYQDGRRGNGYVYTTDRISGYSDVFPGKASRRVLVLEALPDALGGQTDFYLQFGSADDPANEDLIPGNVWFQFWLYPQYYGDQLSQWRMEDKFFYVCNSSYPCHSHKWMLLWGAGAYNPNMLNRRYGTAPFGNPSQGQFLWHLRGAAGVSEIEYRAAPEWDREKLGQTDLSEHMARNRWTLVKMHVDTSTSSGTWEMWLKPLTGSWVKVAEWIDGVTPDFRWRIRAQDQGGHSVLRMPTTVGGVNGQWHDSWVYIDDFVIARSEQYLPTYP